MVPSQAKRRYTRVEVYPPAIQPDGMVGGTDLTTTIIMVGAKVSVKCEGRRRLSSIRIVIPSVGPITLSLEGKKRENLVSKGELIYSSKSAMLFYFGPKFLTST